MVQGLWVGSELSAMERLSIASFLAHGHDYRLYVYGDVAGVPPGAQLRDAAEVLPASAVFRYRDRPSYAGFANFFRYKLLGRHGGWWADTDVVCLKPLDFAEPYVFATEPGLASAVVSSCIFKVPPASEIMAEAWRLCSAKDPRRIVWGETGPHLMTRLVRRFGLERYRKSEATFIPLPPLRCLEALDPDAEVCVDHVSYTVHLWNERWRRSGFDKNARYPAGCLYEKLKRRYLPSFS